MSSRWSEVLSAARVVPVHSPHAVDVDGAPASMVRPIVRGSSSLHALSAIRALALGGVCVERIANAIHVEIRSDDVGPDLGLPHPLHIVLAAAAEIRDGLAPSVTVVRRDGGPVRVARIDDEARAAARTRRCA